MLATPMMKHWMFQTMSGHMPDCTKLNALRHGPFRAVHCPSSMFVRVELTMECAGFQT